MMFDEMLFLKIVVFELSENSEVDTVTDVFSFLKWFEYAHCF